MTYAEVVVNTAVRGQKTFSYAIPSGMRVSPGHAVWAPFGERLLQGIVVELTDIPSFAETRELQGLIDPKPLLSPEQIELAHWLSDYYISPFFNAVALMLPPGFERKSLTFISLAEKGGSCDPSSLDDEERRALNLVETGGEVRINELEKQLGRKLAQAPIARLMRLELLKRSYRLEPVKIKPRYDTWLRLAVSPEAGRNALSTLSKAPSQAALLDYLLERGEVSWKAVREALGVNRAALSALGAKGLIAFEQIRVKREPINYENLTVSPPPSLTSAQEQALESIRTSLSKHEPGVFLLHGVTGSGKTEVYLRALAEAVKLGRRGIVLVPEIALTPQTIERFAGRFPRRVAVLHSKLSAGQRFDEWQGIRGSEFDVVIGPRSALFAPQPNLGLIVIDEEHDPAYKQKDLSPYYHAREVALKLAELNHAVVILGSATPDVATFYQAKKGRYQLLSLPERVREGSPLPKVSIVDLRAELKAGNLNLLSRSLGEKTARALNAGEQVILFLNRRGAATFIQCRHCGRVFRCPRCQVALNYHLAEESLICHQCNYQSRVPRVCPECQSPHLSFLGAGIQKLEQEVRATFPPARILRWDSDTTRGKYAHETILNQFRARQADVLIGTQMVASGLDLPGVTLVGVVSADSALNLPDFRAGERTFQLLCPVAGRAGRGELSGEVIIQTYVPNYYAIDAMSDHNYLAFYEREIEYRLKLGNPPFSRLVKLTYRHGSEAVARREAEGLKRKILEERDERGIPGLRLIGPAPAYIPRLRGRYQWQLTIRSPGVPAFLSQLNLGRGWTIDVDPMGLT